MADSGGSGDIPLSYVVYGYILFMGIYGYILIYFDF